MGPMKIPVIMKEGKGRLFVCPFEGCNKESCRKYNIQAHMRIHTEQTPYECTYPDCGMTFKWRSSLVNHERYHKDVNAAGGSEVAETKGNRVPEDGSLMRLLSNTSTVSSCSSDHTAGDETDGQFYVAVILAEGFSRGSVSGVQNLTKCPQTDCGKLFNSERNLDMHLREH
eukprot:Plantae.Rhodophyta-Purpureofilum_apyrenoidigerum.ctg7244.p1 GENE.Plantae.Rhodophyta-Purpureofilum_apyrenoidigerum.ctg7244~~Plantae.Rhodophyta-Purpureofilum_apyrenoidigerum.ctg7244.p1  ORF type:complete len:171 (+),score=27.16 Plantae.Rhodophyta-Purpureofilum_apyrenoidigerum.ctg7244:316-828(+)